MRSPLRCVLALAALGIGCDVEERCAEVTAETFAVCAEACRDGDDGACERLATPDAAWLDEPSKEQAELVVEVCKVHGEVVCNALGAALSRARATAESATGPTDRAPPASSPSHAPPSHAPPSDTLPPADEPTASPVQVQVRITVDGEVVVDGEPAGVRSLTATDREGHRVVISSDGDVGNARVIEVIDALREAGASRGATPPRPEDADPP